MGCIGGRLVVGAACWTGAGGGGGGGGGMAEGAVCCCLPWLGLVTKVKVVGFWPGAISSSMCSMKLGKGVF